MRRGSDGRLWRRVLATIIALLAVTGAHPAAAAQYDDELWGLAVSGPESDRVSRFLQELRQGGAKPPDWAKPFHADSPPDVATLAKASMPWLQKQLADAKKREFAAMELALLQTAAAPALPALLKIVKDANGVGREAALFPIAAMADKAASAVPAVFAMYQTVTDRDQRIAAIRTLGILRAKDPQMVDALAMALQGARNYQVSAEVANALGNIGSDAAAAAPALIEILARADDETVCRPDQALNALVRIGEPAVPALVTALADKRRPVRFWAGSALVKIGKVPAEAIVTTIGQWQQHDIDGTDATNLSALVSRAEQHASTPLIAAYDGADKEHRRRIVRLACPGGATKSGLRALLEHAAPDKEATACLAQISSAK